MEDEDTANPEGCQYRDYPFAAKCHKLCDEGETLCPHHKLLTSQPMVQESAPLAKPPQGVKTYRTPRAYSE